MDEPVAGRDLIRALLVTLLLGTSAGAQAIRVTSPTEIARETEPRRFTEPHLAVQPGNPDHLLVGAFIVPASGTTETIHAGERCATFASRDGGSTWSRHEFAFVDCGDPQVAILPDGQAVFLALAEIPGLVPKRNSWLFAFHSTDGGVNWDDLPTVLGRPHDHPAVAIDTGSTTRAGWVYVTTHHDPRDGNGRVSERLFVARSRDGGRTFDAPVTVRPNSLPTSGEMPVVLADGTIVASFVDNPTFARRRAWVVRSSDGGTTFSEPLFVTDACGPPPGFQLSALAVDTSDGPFRDRLYFACRQSDGGRIVVTASGDRGDSWNRPGVEVGPGGTNAEARRVMTLAVNNRGVLGVLTVQRTAASDPCLETDFSASLDGGATFTPPARVSVSACGTSPVDVIAGRMMPTYGDYFGLVTTPDGRFRAVWPEMRDGHSVLLTAIVEVDGHATAAVIRPKGLQRD
jgi:hypothetical protein